LSENETCKGTKEVRRCATTERIFRLTGLAVSQLSAMPFDFEDFHDIEPAASPITRGDGRQFGVIQIADETASMLARRQKQLTRLDAFPK
jgi:hypothetical protein